MMHIKIMHVCAAAKKFLNNLLSNNMQSSQKENAKF